MPYQTILVSNAPNREIRSLRGLGRHFFTKQEITVTVMDAGNSRRGLNSCKLIMDKNSLAVCERTLDPISLGVGFVLVQCTGKYDRLFNLSNRLRTVHLSSSENHSCMKFVAKDFDGPRFVASFK